MSIINKYQEQIKAKLDEQLSVYVTIGGGTSESPMWFIFEGIDNNIENEVLKFRSSQNDYMYFSVPLLDDDKGKYFEYKPLQDDFRSLKYAHIKEYWPTVYYELRPSEKPIPEPVKVETPTIEHEDIDYEKQANNFLKATETTFTATYKHHSYHFPEDKQTRDIYVIVLKNKSHRYRFLFGQSINNSDYGNTPPTAYDVLACLTKYDVGDFENFCSDFSYEIDSRKTYKTYKAVMKEWKNVERLFTSEQLEQLQEIS